MIDIEFLLKYGYEGGEDFAKLYNKIANVLYTDFGISGAEVATLITYFVDQYKKGGCLNARIMCINILCNG